MPRDGGDAEHLEEVEGGAEPAGDVGDEEPRSAVDDAAEVAALDASLAEEEGEDGSKGFGAGGEDLRAHAADAAELAGGETDGAEEVDGGAKVDEGDCGDGGVSGGGGEEVDAKGVEEEELLVEGRRGLGRQNGKVWGLRGLFGKGSGDFRGEPEGAGGEGEAEADAGRGALGSSGDFGNLGGEELGIGRKAEAATGAKLEDFFHGKTLHRRRRERRRAI